MKVEKHKDHIRLELTQDELNLLHMIVDEYYALLTEIDVCMDRELTPAEEELREHAAFFYENLKPL